MMDRSKIRPGMVAVGSVDRLGRMAEKSGKGFVDRRLPEVPDDKTEQQDVPVSGRELGE